MEASRMYQPPLLQCKAHSWLGQFHPHPSKHMTEKPTEEMVEKQKEEEDMTHCPICMSMGCECKGKLMQSDWDDDNNEEEPKEMVQIGTAMLTPSPQQYKPYKSPYFDEMLNKPSPRFTLINQKMRDIILAQRK